MLATVFPISAIASQGDPISNFSRESLVFGSILLSDVDGSWNPRHNNIKISLNDGLAYEISNSETLRVTPRGLPALFSGYPGSTDLFMFNDISENSSVLIKSSFENLFFSNNGYYAYIKRQGDNVSGVIYRPNGSKVKIASYYSAAEFPYPAFGQGVKVISAHNKDSYSYEDDAYYGQKRCNTTLSNGYSQACDVQEQGDNIGITNSLGNTWKVTRLNNTDCPMSTVTLPDQSSYIARHTEQGANCYLSPLLYTVPYGLQLNSTLTCSYEEGNCYQYGFSGDRMISFSIDMRSNVRLHYGNLGIGKYLITTSFPDNTVMITENDALFRDTKGTPAQTRGNMLSRKVYDKFGNIMSLETDTYALINGVMTLTQKSYQKNGSSYSLAYSNFNDYNKPQTIIKTDVNGNQDITSITYNITGAPNLNGDIFLIQPLTISKSYKGKVYYTESNGYDAQGFKISSVINGESYNYSYDEKGNLKTKTVP